MITTKELKVSSLIGYAISAGKKSGCVRETEIGIGQTSAWKINVLTPQTATAVYFEVVIPAGQPSQQGSPSPIQFVTHYQHSSRQHCNNYALRPSLTTLPKLVLHMLRLLSTKKLRQS
jgi:protein transport protein SEC23